MSLADLIGKYQSNGNSFGGANTFKLSNDGDSADVRILITSEEDIMKYVVEAHEVTINDGRYPNQVKCLGEGCPMCKQGIKRKLVFYMPLYNAQAKEVQLWKRGISDIQELQVLLKAYNKKGNTLADYTFTIVRSGAKGSKDTKYTKMFTPDGVDVDISKLEVPSILGRDYKTCLDLAEWQVLDVLAGKKLSWSLDTTKEEEVPF